MYYLGLDVGSTMTKGVILKGEEIIATTLGPTGAEHRRLANRVVEQLISQAGVGLSDLSYIVATGYGRLNVPFADKQITEITCHATGVHWLFPGAKTVIDIGGQDCKGIKLERGRVVDFVMNDKCAAGTGRYLEIVAEALGVRLDAMGQLALSARNIAKISSTCTVFAEQEVISRLSEGVPLEDILAGIHDAIADRIYLLVDRLKIEGDVVVTGGTALNTGLVHALKKRLPYEVFVPAKPWLTGALGAALLGAREITKAREKGIPGPQKERRLQELSFFGH
jgi:predicted CoA-substrate-specific enzyme activase